MNKDTDAETRRPQRKALIVGSTLVEQMGMLCILDVRVTFTRKNGSTLVEQKACDDSIIRREWNVKTFAFLCGLSVFAPKLSAFVRRSRRQLFAIIVHGMGLTLQEVSNRLTKSRMRYPV